MKSLARISVTAPPDAHAVCSRPTAPVLWSGTYLAQTTLNRLEDEQKVNKPDWPKPKAGGQAPWGVRDMFKELTALTGRPTGSDSPGGRPDGRGLSQRLRWSWPSSCRVPAAAPGDLASLAGPPARHAC